MKQLSKTGYGVGLKGLFYLEDNAAVTASIGATYYTRKSSYDDFSNDLIPRATAIIPAKVGFRYLFADTYFIEPQIGYGVSIVDIFGNNSQSGGGFIFSPTIGFKNEGENGITAYLQYNLFNSKIAGVNYNLSNISMGIGMNIW
ncbi:MAG: hypothetical protein NTZ59_00115 [Bacteroidetes bacterium]|nr:hypothetical protein [Bacteroidota bacterium]